MTRTPVTRGFNQLAPLAFEVVQPVTFRAGFAAYWQGGGLRDSERLPESVQSLLDSGGLKEYAP